MPVPVDVLEDDDGVVDKHADAQRQPAERDQVEREAGEVHQRERGQHRERDRHGDHGGGAQVAQEQQQDQDGEHRAVHPRLAHVGDRALDVLAGVVDEDDPRATAVLAVDEVDLLLETLHHLDRVGVGLLGHAHDDARPAVDPLLAHDLLERVAHVGHVADVDRTPGSGGGAARLRLGQLFAGPRGAALRPLRVGPPVDQHRAHLLDRAQLAECADQDLAARLGHVAGRHVAVVAAQRLDDLIAGDAERDHARQRQLDADLAQAPAIDLHRRDAGQALEPAGQHLVGQVAQAARIAATAQPERGDRRGRDVELEDGRLLGVLGQLGAQPVERLAHVAGRRVQVGAPVELQLHARQPLGRLALQRGDALDRGHRALDRPGQEVLDLLRADAGIVRDDRDAREVDLGQEVDRQARGGDAAQDADDDAEHRHADRAPDREPGPPAGHRRSVVRCESATWMRLPWARST
jgi:hypothetical protein